MTAPTTTALPTCPSYKIVYLSYADADAAIRRIRRPRNHRDRRTITTPYRCRESTCGAWHLTSQKSAERRARNTR